MWSLVFVEVNCFLESENKGKERRIRIDVKDSNNKKYIVNN